MSARRRSTGVRLAAACGAAFLMSGCAAATTATPQADRSTEPAHQLDAGSAQQLQAVDDVAMAARLAEYGRRENSRVALIAAAEILQRYPLQPIDGRTEETAVASPAVPAGTRADAPPRQLSVDALLTEAAAGNTSPEITTLIAQARERASMRGRGAEGGARLEVWRVSANHTRTHWIRFRGGEPGAVAIEGDGDTDLDLYVYDENNNLIGRSIGLYDSEVVRFRPAWTGPFRIEVRNLGNVWNEYYLATN